MVEVWLDSLLYVYCFPDTMTPAYPELMSTIYKMRITLTSQRCVWESLPVYGHQVRNPRVSKVEPYGRHPLGIVGKSRFLDLPL